MDERGAAGGRLAGRLHAARERAFAGRKEELAAFEDALCGGGTVLFVHGPGGVGKSALLRCFAARAGEAGRSAVVLDGRLLDPSPAAFLAEAAPVLGDERAVLLVDAFERLHGLAPWFRERFLPALPACAVVVVAGRTPPDLAWRADPGWADVLSVLELRGLEPMDANVLLDARAVPGELRDPLLTFAGGHPLALALGAATATGAAWAPGQDVIAALLDHVVGDVPGPAHRQALEVCAQTYRSTEDVLRAVLPGEDAAALFSWLRRLPFVESSPLGLSPHDVVRGIVDADLRWRDPRGHADLRGRIEDHLTRRIHTAADADVLHAVGALFYLHRNDNGAPAPHVWRAADQVREDVFRPEDTGDLLRLATEADAAVVAHWLARQPQAFRLYRATAGGELVGACAWLRLESDVDDDSLAAAAWAGARAHGPPRHGEHLVLHRSWVRGSDWGASQVVELIRWRAVGWALRAERVAWSCAAVRRDGPARQHHIGDHVWDGDREHVLLAHDWRTVPARVWLDRLLSGGGRATPAGPEPGFAVLSQAEFTDAVRTALRHLSKHKELAANPLTRGRLLAGAPDPAAALRALLADAIRELGRDPMAAKPYRALDATYLRGAPTQEAAAERLGLSFSTYRRHLLAGIERLGDDLWRRELG